MGFLIQGPLATCVQIPPAEVRPILLANSLSLALFMSLKGRLRICNQNMEVLLRRRKSFKRFVQPMTVAD